MYTDEDIQKNRDACRNCEFSTKNDDGKLNMKSRCMAVDPKTEAPCDCFVMCKTQAGVCPIDKWDTTPLTIEREEHG